MAKNLTAASSWRYDFDPLRWAWRLLTSVRFAMGLIGFLALASLLGVLLPQIPIQMRDSPAAVAGWLQFQEARYGGLTEPMYRLGLFNVFSSPWFVFGLGLLVVSVAVCTANRLPPIWRNVFRPQTRVHDEYFQRGELSMALAVPERESLVEELRRRRYKVSVFDEGGTKYLFADRFPWAQLATFISHLALILFLAGGLVTVVSARDEDMLIAEGETRPVFGVGDSDHMQVQMEDAVGRFNEEGFPLDYRSFIVVYKGGTEVARGVTTVNDPLSYDGYNFHQTAYFEYGAALRVRELSSDRVVYDEVLTLTSSAATPRVIMRDASGDVVLDDLIIPTDFIADTAGTLVHVPQLERQFWIGARPGAGEGGWQLIVFETGEPSGAREVLREGEQRDLGGLSVRFDSLTAVPSGEVDGLPGAEGTVIAELADDPDGDSLTLGPIGRFALVLAPGEPVVVGDYEYKFLGQREFGGITVRRDPGSTFIWVATGFLLLGLALTFYTPRRRLWVRLTGSEALFRGLGGRRLAIEKELRQIAQRLNGSERR